MNESSWRPNLIAERQGQIATHREPPPQEHFQFDLYAWEKELPYDKEWPCHEQENESLLMQSAERHHQEEELYTKRQKSYLGVKSPSQMQLQ